MKSLFSSDESLHLVPPDPERDTPFALNWFEGEKGRQTLLLMGNAENTITPTNYQKEYDILRSFKELERLAEQLTWMIITENKTIGAIWVELKDTDYLQAPAISIMIGDPDYRGRGIGKNAMQTVILFLKNEGFKLLHARRLVSNKGSASLLDSLGFVAESEPYTDNDNLTFQNFYLPLWQPSSYFQH